jgi:hypothetical protein
MSARHLHLGAVGIGVVLGIAYLLMIFRATFATGVSHWYELLLASPFLLLLPLSVAAAFCPRAASRAMFAAPAIYLAAGPLGAAHAFGLGYLRLLPYTAPFLVLATLLRASTRRGGVNDAERALAARLAAGSLGVVLGSLGLLFGAFHALDIWSRGHPGWAIGPIIFSFDLLPLAILGFFRPRAAAVSLAVCTAALFITLIPPLSGQHWAVKDLGGIVFLQILEIGPSALTSALFFAADRLGRARPEAPAAGHA